MMLFFRSKRIFFVLLFGLNLLLHAPFFNMPPKSIHVWRQCNTLAVARNFYEEEMNLLKPRVDRRLDGNGITGMQFPSYEYSLALLYKVFGSHVLVHRLFSFFIFSVGVLFVYLFFRHITKNHLAGAVAAWSFTWSPELYYHCINALPDILALSASIAGLYYFIRWQDSPKVLWLVLSGLCIALAGLTKMQYLSVGAPIAYFVIIGFSQRKFQRTTLFQLFSFAAFTLGLTFLWYYYARQLIKTSHLHDFVIEIRPLFDDAKLAFLVLKQNIVSDLPELLLNYASFALFLVGIWAFFKNRKSKTIQHWILACAFWALVLLIYHVLELSQLKHHQYYMMPYFLLLLFPVTLGAMYLKKRKWATVLSLLLLVQPALAFLRISGRWLQEERRAVPMALYEKESRVKLIQSTSEKDLCIVGPDPSGCIYFYYLHKKGFGFDQTDDLFTTAPGSSEKRIKNYIDRGAVYLYIHKLTAEQKKTLAPFVETKLDQVGEFSVYRLKAPTELQSAY